MIWKKFRNRSRPDETDPAELTTSGKTVIDQPAEKGAKSKASDSGKSPRALNPRKADRPKTESPKADATKAERAKEKTAEKSKSAEKVTLAVFNR